MNLINQYLICNKSVKQERISRRNVINAIVMLSTAPHVPAIEFDEPLIIVDGWVIKKSERLIFQGK